MPNVPPLSDTSGRNTKTTFLPPAWCVLQIFSAKFPQSFCLIKTAPTVWFCYCVCVSPQDGTEEDEALYGMAVGGDGSIVLVGGSPGVWTTQHEDEWDFVAVKLDANGNEVWRWQVRRCVPSAQEREDYSTVTLYGRSVRRIPVFAFEGYCELDVVYLVFEFSVLADKMHVVPVWWQLYSCRSLW